MQFVKLEIQHVDSNLDATGKTRDGTVRKDNIFIQTLSAAISDVNGNGDLVKIILSKIKPILNFVQISD